MSELDSVDQDSGLADPPKHVSGSLKAGIVVGKILRQVAEYLPVIALAVGVIWFTEYRYQQVQSQLKTRPPIAVMNYETLLKGLDENSSQKDIEQVLAIRDKVVKRLADAGYVVLDGNTVVGTTDSVVVGGNLTRPGARTPTDVINSASEIPVLP